MLYVPGFLKVAVVVADFSKGSNSTSGYGCHWKLISPPFGGAPDATVALNCAVPPAAIVSVGGEVFSTLTAIASTTMVVLAVTVLPSLSFTVTETEYNPGFRVLIKVKVLSLPSPLPLQE